MSIKSFIANKVKTVLKQDIEDYSDFLDGMTEISQSTFDSYIDEISDKLCDFFKKEAKIPVELMGGADKNVLVFDKLDFVVKIPKVTGERELNVYIASEAYGFNHYFAEVELITSFNYWDKEIVAYFQKKVDFSKGSWLWEREYSSNEVKDLLKEAKRLEDYKVELVDGSFSKIIKGSKLAQFLVLKMDVNERCDFISFLIDEKINDLNNNNFYISRDGKLTIFDYSGYDDSYKYDEDGDYEMEDSYESDFSD